MTRLSAIQMASSNNVQDNVTRACYFIEMAAKNGAKLTVLPENFATLGLRPEEVIGVAENFQAGDIQSALQHCAKQNKIWIIGGTLPLRGEGNRPFSSSIVWDNKGEVVGRYDKIHLFDVSVQGGESYAESQTIQPGAHSKVLKTPFGSIGMAVCYDLRFPELFRVLVLKGAQVLVLPSAFTLPTGKAHWETLLKARAIENLCYMIAPGETGKRANGVGTYGHTMIIGPWGETLASVEQEEGVIVADIDIDKMEQLRKKFPVLTHIRSFVVEELQALMK